MLPTGVAVRRYGELDPRGSGRDPSHLLTAEIHPRWLRDEVDLRLTRKGVTA